VRRQQAVDVELRPLDVGDQVGVAFTTGGGGPPGGPGVWASTWIGSRSLGNHTMSKPCACTLPSISCTAIERRPSPMACRPL